MIEMREVYSSSVDKIGYQDGRLVVLWKNGKTSTYAGVPQELAGEVVNAASVGKALRESVMGKFPHGYLEE